MNQEQKNELIEMVYDLFISNPKNKTIANLERGAIIAIKSIANGKFIDLNLKISQWLKIQKVFDKLIEDCVEIEYREAKKQTFKNSI
jgi:hypothetical protein